MAEVVAAHYLRRIAAPRTIPTRDTCAPKRSPRCAVGAQRAAALGAPQTAERAYRTAIDLAADEEERIDLIKAAGEMALLDGRHEDSLELFEDAASRLRSLGRDSDASRLALEIGHALRRVGRAADAVELMNDALTVLDAELPEGPDAALMNVELGVALLAAGRARDAVEPLERALELAQGFELPHVLARALTYKAQLCVALGRADEAGILFDGTIELCRRYELLDMLSVLQLNSGDFLTRFDLPGAAGRSTDALAAARRVGSRFLESAAASNLMRFWEYAGAWDELERLGVDLLDASPARPGAEYVHLELALLATSRGNISRANEHFASMASWRHSEANERRWTYAACEATIAVAGGDAAGALDLLSGAMGEIISVEGVSSQASRIGFPVAVEAALQLGHLHDAGGLLELIEHQPPGHVPPFARAQVALGWGLVAAADGDTVAAEAQLVMALNIFDGLRYPYWAARVRLELAYALIGSGRPNEIKVWLDSAIETLRVLRARPALERAERLLTQVPISAFTT